MEIIDRHPIPSSVNAFEPEIRRSSYTDVPPAHYTLKVNSFSSLCDIVRHSGTEKYESGEFEAGGYKWKLLLYPNGDAKRNGDGHISLYLALVADTNSIINGSPRVVDVVVRFFVYDHIQNHYLIIQDGETKRYHALKTEHGFHRLLPLSAFKNSRNGFLVEDCCAFGAEVFVIKNTGRGQELSFIKDPQNGFFSWKIDNFSNLQDRYYYSEVFNVGGYNWKLLFHPKGDSNEKGRSLSLYLKLDEDQQVFAEVSLVVKDQVCGMDRKSNVSMWFGAWGSSSFMPLSDLGDASKGFLVKDSLVLEAKLTLVSSIKNFS